MVQGHAAEQLFGEPVRVLTAKAKGHLETPAGLEVAEAGQEPLAAPPQAQQIQVWRPTPDKKAASDTEAQRVGPTKGWLSAAAAALAQAPGVAPGATPGVTPGAEKTRKGGVSPGPSKSPPGISYPTVDYKPGWKKGWQSKKW